jgi:hypothetical protein
MSYSLEYDSKNKSLGRGSYNKQETRKTGLRLDEHKMPPIVDFCSDEIKQSDYIQVEGPRRIDVICAKHFIEHLIKSIPTVSIKLTAKQLEMFR